MTQSNRYHHTIMAQEVIDALPTSTRTVLDGTVGHGGHLGAIADKLCLQGVDSVCCVGIDKDQDMLSTARERIGEKRCVTLGQCAYDEWDTIREISGLDYFDFILLDIGINRGHIRDASRGFSIKADGPLDMRFDARESNTSPTASEYIQQMDVGEFAAKLEKYGDFSPTKANQVSLHIVRTKKHQSLETTLSLVSALKEIGLGGKMQAIVFQVLRIIVNNELGHLERFLDSFGDHLTSGGRCAIMTFHSIEDRIVKRAFRSLAQSEGFTLINKRVIKPHRQEREKNKASRSAKLRIIEKV